MLKMTGKILLLLCLFIMTACSSQTPTAIPTPDLNPIRTEVAATVLAQVAQICALTPSPTQVAPPTETATVIPTSAPSATSTQTTGTPATNDLAMWVSQTVQDDTTFLPGQKFTMTWTIKNVGTSTWTTGYRLRFYSGVAFGVPNNYIMLDKEVKPGETVDITAQMEAPLIPAEYRSDWVMSNESLRNFKEPVFLKIKVAKPSATQTLTVTATATVPTQTPTITSTP
jgi:hypothetical protein